MKADDCSQPPKRADKRPARTRGPGTIAAIIDAAERLWGAHGIEGASLREISIAAGSANNSSVRYHFGDKQGLIRGIFEARLPALEERREHLLKAAEADGTLDDPVTLLRIMLKPVFEAVDPEGRHPFAAFLRAINRFPEWDTQAGQSLAPISNFVLDALRQQLSRFPKKLVDARIRLMLEIAYSAITDQDDTPTGMESDPCLANRLFEDALIISANLLFLDAPA